MGVLQLDEGWVLKFMFFIKCIIVLSYRILQLFLKKEIGDKEILQNLIIFES